MPPEIPVQQISKLALLLSGGGLPYLVLGLVFALIGVAIAIGRGPRRAAVVVMWMSPLTGIVTMCALYLAFAQLIELETISPTPKPSAFGSVSFYALSAGILGMLGTIAAMSSAFAALYRTVGTDSSTI